MNDVILLLPPLVSGNWPSLSLSILKSIFTENKINSEIIHSNLHFKRMVHESLYEQLCGMFNYNDIIDFIFAGHAFPETTRKQRIFYNKTKNKNSIKYDQILNLITKTDSFLDKTYELISSKSPKLVIINSGLKQLASSIAISRTIKKINPGITIAIYGYNCRKPAGNEILKIADSIDYIFDDDPENSIVDFYNNIMNNESLPSHIINCKPVVNLDTLPFPDFSDYFRELDQLWFRYTKRTVCIESSRGCSWGEKGGCLFCGHGNNCKYILKSPERFIEELEFLIETYKPEQIQTTDYIMPDEYPEKVFKKIKLDGIKNLFYELNPNTGLHELKILKSAGMNICQPGIESLNDDLLKLLNKNTSGLTNIIFLRNCKTIGIKPLWNLIYNIPGENVSNYYEMLEKIIPYIFHLYPPFNTRKIYIQQNSPLLADTCSNEISNIKPYDMYNYILPDNANINILSIFYNADYKNAFSDEALKQEFFKLIKKWKDSWKNDPPVLKIIRDDNNCFLNDTRGVNDVGRFEINDRHLLLLKKLMMPADKNDLDNTAGSLNCTKELEDLLELKTILVIKGKYISLVENNFS